MNESRSRSDSDDDPGDEPRLVSVIEGEGATRYIYAFPERPPQVRVEHDPKRRVIRVEGPGGRTAVFRDEPVRFLVLEADPLTGEMSPVRTRRGEPKYLYLCREERERG